MSDDTVSDETEYVIRVGRHRNGEAWAAVVPNGCVGTSPASASGLTPESALISLVSTLRGLHRDLGSRAYRAVEEDGQVPLFIWLTRAGIT